jgi:polygalacturonase
MKSKILVAAIIVLSWTNSVQLSAQDKKSEMIYSWTNLPVVTQPTFRKDTFSIIRYGAISDGTTLNTKSINEAISTCSEKGGGVVVVPGGLWLTGPLEMKSNVNLHLEQNAILLFTADFNQYSLVEGVYEGRRSARNQSPIYGNDLINIAITGNGIIDGNGDAWRMVGRDKLTESEWKNKVASGGSVSEDGKMWYPSAKTRLAQETKRTSTMEPGQTLKDFDSIKDYLRPNLLVFNNCKNVLLEGVTFQNSPAWCLHPLMCENLTVRNVFVKNPDYAQNGDGIDVESCKNVLIEGSTFDVGDDGICIKSGKDEEGRRRGRPTENVIIRNNTVYKAHGGFVIGSEMSGGAKNIFVSDCSFIGTDNGLRFKTARGRGGLVENIFVKNIRMKDIGRDAILFDMYYFMKPPAQNEKVVIPSVTEATPQFRNFYIDNIVCIGAGRGIFIRGLPEMSVQNIVLNNLMLKTTKGAELIEAANIQLNNVQLLSDKTKPVVYIENGKNISFDYITYTANPELWLSVNGEKSGNINVVNKDSAAHGKVEFNSGANASMLKMK